MQDGHEGWDDYAPFYDWENARTLGRRDVPFWRNLALQSGGRVLELGCGTGRISLPLARAGVELVGIDRSGAMLDRARARVRRAKLTDRVQLVRGDIRTVPFHGPGFAMVMAPYGILQSLLRERDLESTLNEVRRVLRNRRTVMFIVVFPSVFFFMFGLSSKAQSQGGPAAVADIMISMAGYDAMVGTTTGGAAVAVESSLGWGRQLRLRP